MFAKSSSNFRPTKKNKKKIEMYYQQSKEMQEYVDRRKKKKKVRKWKLMREMREMRDTEKPTDKWIEEKEKKPKQNWKILMSVISPHIHTYSI